MSLGWTPTIGEHVTLKAHNPWRLPAGRYELREYAGVSGYGGGISLHGVTATGWAYASRAELRQAESIGQLAPVSPAEVERERQVLALRAGSPLRSTSPQHDASDLALFRSANEPGLL